ncbi:MAG TPA: hypothetical protein VN814_09595 [Caulobacteraceae bacterium]|nr:hypothetical protein [Caulobacteraceae bacterium]
MSLTGQPDTCSRSDFSKFDARSLPMAAPPGWISRHKAAIEATATMTLAMSAPILAAVATLQTTA